MKMKPFKIGTIIITPKMTLSLILALFILGLGIGTIVASSGDSKFALVISTVISIRLILNTFSKATEN